MDNLQNINRHHVYYFETLRKKKRAELRKERIVKLFNLNPT
jgi:hypothetical protein